MNRGLFIVFEGIDGAGKSTQAQRLVETLTQRGVPVLYTREPTDGPHGRALRASAATGRLPPAEELALFIADRRSHVNEEIEPALARGVTVVLDRYYLSTAAYQGARGLDPQAILRENEAFAPAPDVCFLFDIDPAVGVGRVRGRDGTANLFEEQSELARCRAVFATLDRPWIFRLDGSQPIALLSSQIAEEVSRRLARRYPHR
jgi:dTMP kinase